MDDLLPTSREWYKEPGVYFPLYQADHINDAPNVGTPVPWRGKQMAFGLSFNINVDFEFRIRITEFDGKGDGIAVREDVGAKLRERIY